MCIRDRNTTSYVLLAFPALVGVIAIGDFWGHQLWKIMLVIGIFSAPLIFRVIRASTLSYSTRDFVLAAKALGASDRRILAREILPNILPTVISFGLIAVASLIVLEGTLAFLGLSVPPPTPSWGNMLNEGSSLLAGGKDVYKRQMLTSAWPSQVDQWAFGGWSISSRATVARGRCSVIRAQPPMALVMMTQRSRSASPT